MNLLFIIDHKDTVLLLLPGQVESIIHQLSSVDYWNKLEKQKQCLSLPLKQLRSHYNQTAVRTS